MDDQRNAASRPQNGEDAAFRPAPPPLINAPPVVTALVIALGAVYLLFLISPRLLEARLEFWLTLWPQRVLMGGNAPGGWVAAIGPLFSHMFVHTALIHLLVNAGFLLAFGAPAALRMGVGIPGADQRKANIKFLLFFILSGLAAGIVSVAVNPNELQFARGASGAISGLLGAVVRFALRPHQARLENPWGMLGLLDRRVLVVSAIIVVSNIAIMALPFFGMNIAGEAHIGGYIFGLIAFPLFALRPGRRV